VLVQGPPGTGKSHTIANLIGHLLAKGKRILVTSQTSKALKVVREKVVSPLQPLCVANLSNDSESKAQLKESINGIVNYISKTDFGKISKQIDSLKSKRDALKENLKNLEAQALKIRRSEYTDIVIAGETSINPTEAAKYIQNHQEENSWIPSPIKQGSPLPVTTEELQVIYKANGLYSSTEEKCLDDGMLELSQLPTPQEIQEISNLKQEVSKNTDKSFLEHFEKSDAINEPNFEEFIDQFESTLNSILKDDWSKRVFKKLVIDPNRLSPWEELLELIELTYKNITANENIIFSKNPKVNFEWTDEIYQSCVNLSGHLSAKGKVSWASVLFNRSWKMILENSTVDGKRPEKAEDIRAISLIYENKIARERLIERWHRQMVANGSSPLDDSEPELQARTFLKQLETIVSWHNTVWDEAIEYFESIGFKLNQALEAKNIDLRASSDELLEFLISTVIPSLKHKRNSLKLKRIDKQIDQFLKILEHKEFSENSKAFYINDLKYSIENLDHAIYKESYKKLERLAALSETHKLRNGILLKLKEYAPKWANLIKERMSPHNINAIPGDPLVAWKVRQYIQELDDRHKEDYNEVQKRLDLTKRQLDSVNAEYVEALSWRYQLKRTGLEQKQNLIGWQQLQEKITKTGRGKMDSKRKRESRGLLKKCKDSVPVWIMPLSKVYESFDFKGNDFDVLILDEASQSDITAIIALGIAKEVIIVGDKEQVTPQGIGQDLTQIQSLIDEYLEGIPNKMSYDGKTSIYDIAEQSFGETIRLVEHFRCVPEIIHFSNYLSYNGEIKPLREKSDGHFKQSLVEHRVFGKRADNGKVNKIEAQEIASLVTAMTKDPSYSNLSIGVISLLGSHQTTAIDTLLQTHLPPSVYEKHNILCGDSANFQGDERDVIFLSMIDSCDKPPLRIVQSDTYKKRYNVAASRAKDQLWVVHSLNYDTDLQSGDLRQRLISHIRNPHSTAEKISSANELADSDFEKRVQKDLITRGYHITPQWEVGSFRIDIVVHCGDKRMAIECDGDKHHTDENLADDINRQGILERLGWKFIRIRGSEYYRHPEKTIEKVISTLNDNDIEPEDSSSAEGPTDNDNTIRDLHLKAEKIRSEWGGSSELLNEIEIDSSSLEDEEDEDKDPPQKNKSSNSNSKDHVENSNAFSKLSIETQTNQVRHLKIGSEEELESGDSIDSQVAIKIEPPSSTVRDDILKKYTDDDHLITEELDGTEAEPSPNSIVNMQGGSNRESSMPAEMLTIERARNKVSGPGDECWFKISKNTELQKFQKSQAYNVGKFIKSERDLSEKLTYWAVKIIYDLVKSGAKTDSWSHSTFGLKMIEMELFLEYYNPKDLS
jgi:very-short-patch-repair endonuclease